MFDVRPTKRDGSLDLERIRGSKKIVRIGARPMAKISETSKTERPAYVPLGEIIKCPRKKCIKLQHTYGAAAEFRRTARRPNIVQLGKIVSPDLVSVSKVGVPRTPLGTSSPKQDAHSFTDFSSQSPEKKIRQPEPVDVLFETERYESAPQVPIRTKTVPLEFERPAFTARKEPLREIRAESAVPDELDFAGIIRSRRESSPWQNAAKRRIKRPRERKAARAIIFAFFARAPFTRWHICCRFSAFLPLGSGPCIPRKRI